MVDQKLEAIVIRRLRTDRAIGSHEDGRTAALHAAQSSDEPGVAQATDGSAEVAGGNDTTPESPDGRTMTKRSRPTIGRRG
jgi:hypothetical protein